MKSLPLLPIPDLEPTRIASPLHRWLLVALLIGSMAILVLSLVPPSSPPEAFVLSFEKNLVSQVSGDLSADEARRQVGRAYKAGLMVAGGTDAKRDAFRPSAALHAIVGFTVSLLLLRYSNWTKEKAPNQALQTTP